MQFARMVLTATLIAATGAVLAQDRRPDARLAFSSTAFGLVFGYQSGQGALEFQGRKYPFTVSGIKAATLGISKVDALGGSTACGNWPIFPDAISSSKAG